MLRSALRRRGGDEQADDHLKDTLGTLLSRAGRGDQAAFADLYDALAPLLYGSVLKVVRDPAQSEEVTQEAFVELWRLAPRYDASRGSVRSWAVTIAHRRAIDRVRSEQSARDRAEREAQKRPIQYTDVAEHAVANIDGTRVRNALERLTEIQRQAVELAYFGGHSYREVALLLDVAEGTIKTRIRDGMIRLRDELGVAT
ncbi:MAG: polymerase sigma-70 factor, subfamily [Ilumatobacteraceae bacterium]|jgi:RNA polymerase sigma-70 factor (ECF subfamily)